MRTIKTCPGIGDSIWLMMKLINQIEKFHWKIGNGSPQRGHQLFDLFPQLTESFEYIPECGYNKVKRHAYYGAWSTAPQEMYLEANSHLEAGKRIETFLPDLETSFILPYQMIDEDKKKAEWLLKDVKLAFRYENNEDFINNQVTVDADIIQYPLIGIYTSAYSNARQWDGWTAKEWLQLIRLIQDYNKEYKFVIIGADYDIGIPSDIMMCLQPEDYINTIGQPLLVVVEILKRLDMFFGFPSGLSIINETIGAKQTVMFYPQHLKKLMTAWPDPKRIENGSYKGCIFCEPKQIFDWMILNNKI